MPVNQRAPARVLTLPGQQFPPHTSVAQSPSTGNLQLSPLMSATQIYAVDSQTITIPFNIAAATITPLSVPVTTFTGLLNPAARVYSGATALTNTVTSNVVPLQVVPEVQLLLLTYIASEIQNNTSGPAIVVNFPGLQTTAICSNTAINTMIGPIFPGSTTYTAFSVSGGILVYNPSATTPAVGSLVLTIQAILCGVNLA